MFISLELYHNLSLLRFIHLLTNYLKLVIKGLLQMSNQSPTEQDLQKSAEKIANAQHLLVLTGAGISAESGIPTFRDAQTGFWEKYDPAELASPQGFRENPKLVWDWYEYRRDIVRKNRPNPAHFALAELANYLPKLTLVTQNVDQYHTIAGSKNVLELHGRILENRCFREGRLLNDEELDHSSIPPKCPCGAYARAGVVWFGESLPPKTLAAAFQASHQADLCLVVGTSGVVEPAASLPFEARAHGATVIEINNLASAITSIAQIFLQGKAGEVLPAIMKIIKEKQQK